MRVAGNAASSEDHAAVLDCAVRIKQFSANGPHVLLHDIGRNPPQPKRVIDDCVVVQEQEDFVRRSCSGNIIEP